jgi:putative ABC transport system permease protein
VIGRSVIGTALRTVGGTGVAATAVLALLVLGCVFVALAGPRASLGLRNQALHQTIATVPPLATTVAASADINEFEQAPATAGDTDLTSVTPAQMGTVKEQLAGDLSADGLTLGPPGEAWAGLAAPFGPVTHGAGPGAVSQAPPVLQVVYHDELGHYSQLVAGQYPDGAPPGAQIAVAVTQKMASQFGLHPGSLMRMNVPGGSMLTVGVSGVIRVRNPSSAYWATDPTLVAPTLIKPLQGPSYWQGAVLVGAGGLDTLERLYSPTDLPMQWQFPLRLGGLSANQAQPMQTRLTGITAHTPTLTGSMSASAAALQFATPTVAQTLLTFLAAQNSVDSVLSLVFVGLTVIGAVVLLLAAQMVTARRAGEWAVLRARGASLRQIAGLALRDTALAVVPATLVGGGVAVALTPGETVPLAWWLAAATVLTALAGPPVAAAIRHKPVRQATVTYQTGALQPTGIANTGPRRSKMRRLVAEIALVTGAVGGLVLLRYEGLSRSGSVNVFTSAAPVLVAVPAAILVLRLYPLALRCVQWLSARRAGVTGFLATARTSRAPASVLPVFALVLALTLAAFAGMVRDAVTRGEVAASWQANGVDAVVNATSVTGGITPGDAAALARVPGVQHAAGAAEQLWGVRGGGTVTVVAVDPASYAAVVANTPWAPFPTAKLARTGTGPAPVLASPAAVGVLGRGATQLQSVQGQIPVKVAGVMSTTPALPGGGTFVIVPSWALPAAARAQPPGFLLLAGPGLNGAELTRTASRLMPGSAVSLRSADLARLTGSPLPRAAYLGFAVGLAAAAGFSVAILLLELALAADARRMTLARLATMGLGRGQAGRLTLLETLPAVLAAGLAGAACALVLVPLTAPVLNLSVFTGTSAAVPLKPDFSALGLPVAGLVIIAVATLLLQIRVERHRGVTTALRAGQ